jgi:hypothetical protein
MTTVLSSGAVISLSGAQMKLAPPWSLAASMEAFTAAEVIGVPSWKVTPLRRWKVQVSLSALASHDSARAGVYSVAEPGEFFHSSGS